MNSFLARRPVKYSLITIVIMVVIIVTLPFAIQFGAEYALKEQGAKKVSIEDINLNLFTGEFELIQLSATFNEQPPLMLERLFVELEVSALFQSRIILNKIDIKGFNAVVVRDKNAIISVNGYQIPVANNATPEPATKESKPLEFALNSLTLSDSSLLYQEPEFEQNINLNSIQVSNIKSWEQDSVAQALINLNESNTTIKADMAIALFGKTKTAQGSLNINGLSTHPYKKFYKAHLDKLNALIDADVTFNIGLAEHVKGNIKHNVTVSQLDVNYQQSQAKLEQLKAQGNIDVDGSIINSDHNISLSELDVQHQQLRYVLKQLTTQGKVALNDKDIAVDTELTMKNSLLTDLVTSTPLNSIKTLSLNELHYDAKQLSFKQLSLNEIEVIENKEKKKLLSLSKLALNELKFNLQDSTLNLALVELQQPDINATLSAKKQLTHLDLIQPILERLKPAKTVQPISDNKKQTKPMVINVQKVRLTKPGMLHFNDLSIDPIYSTDLHFNTIQINQVSTEKAADFKLALKQGEYTTIDINGQGLLFNPVENLSYTVDVKQLDLPPMSSYTSKTMGYGVKSGVVDTVITGSIKKQKIDTKVVLKIDSIEVIETNKETAEEISGASGMSIDLALSTLKDKNNIIDLEMPIGGDIKKPDFDLSLIINKAMGIAMKTASMSYLKHALQPFSSLVTLFSLAKDAASSISLAPISFETNNTQLTSKQKELLNKVSTILIERPGIKIKACGIASLSDQAMISAQLLDAKKQSYLKDNKSKKLNKKLEDAALNKITVSEKERHQAMKTLADKRSASVKAYLTKTKKIKSSKILNCLSAENLDKKSKPVVELVI